MVFLELIDSDEQETISSQRHRYHREIVSAVKRKGLAGYWRFCDCFIIDRGDISQNDSILYILRQGIIYHISVSAYYSIITYYSILSYTEARMALMIRSDLQPTMAELSCLPVQGRTINIAMAVPKHKTTTFGMGLLLDQDIVGDIIGRCGDNNVIANTEVLQAWLDGKGGIVTWRYLWTILYIIGCLDLSKDIMYTFNFLL